MANPKKQCNTCRYWRRTSGGLGRSTASKCCHYLLATGKRRVEIDGICKSYEKAGNKRVKKQAEQQ